MKATVAVLATVAGAAVGQTPSSPPTPTSGHVITRPDWDKKPTGQDLASAYPDMAQRFRIDGSASVRCAVKVDGRLDDCEMMQEAPAGVGFGDAALRAVRTFRMRPQTEDGRPVEGGVVSIPLNFRQNASPLWPLGQGEPAYVDWPLSEGGKADFEAPCEDRLGTRCARVWVRWRRTPEPSAFLGLYGLVGVRCAIGPAGALADCKGTALTPAAHIDAALAHATGFLAPETLNGLPTTGRFVNFVIKPMGPEDVAPTP